MRIDKHILFRLLCAKVSNPDIRWLAQVIIFHDPVSNHVVKGNRSLLHQVPPHKSLFHTPPDKGLPIGNLTSQFFANVYLDQLDQFVKHTLKCRWYMRYVDDFIILSPNLKQLRHWKKEIQFFLAQKLKLGLNPQKERHHPVSDGIHWLGYVVKQEYTLVQRHVVHALKNKLFRFNQHLTKHAIKTIAPDGQYSLPFTPSLPPASELKKMLATIHSYYGYFKHADTFRLRLNLWQNHFGLLQQYIEPANKNILSFRLRPTYIKNIKESRRA